MGFVTEFIENLYTEESNDLIKCLITFFISMIPVVELRGAIPVAVANGLSPLVSLTVAVIGNLVPVPFIILFIRRIFQWIRRHIPKLNRLIDRLEEKGRSKKAAIDKSIFWGVFVFVAVPLPGTGAWTGALIAAMLDIRLKRAFPSIAMGVLTAGLIVSLVSYGVAGVFSV